MRIGVVGAGAIGGYLAAELSAGGAEVILVRRKGGGAQADMPVAIRVNGAALHARSSLIVTDDYERLAGIDIGIVAVKSPATEEVAAALERALPPNTPVVSFQNGLRNIDTLRAKLG